MRRNDAEVETPVEQLQLDDVVIVQPGVRMPVDGAVAVGRSAVNQAPVTGESLPVDKAPGDPVFAGTINGEGALEVRVTRLAKDSTLARVMKMVEEAQAQKSPTQQTVEHFERIFVPAVLIGALLVIVVPPLFGVPIRESFLRAMTLLVAASPCAWRWARRPRSWPAWRRPRATACWSRAARTWRTWVGSKPSPSTRPAR